MFEWVLNTPESLKKIQKVSNFNLERSRKKCVTVL